MYTEAEYGNRGCDDVICKKNLINDSESSSENSKYQKLVYFQCFDEFFPSTQFQFTISLVKSKVCLFSTV